MKFNALINSKSKCEKRIKEKNELGRIHFCPALSIIPLGSIDFYGVNILLKVYLIHVKHIKH